jgi:quercetin dioxygenase-like cupin family protein
MCDISTPPSGCAHPATEHVTVVSGALMVGMGEKFDESQMNTLPAGAFGMIPAGMHHYAKARVKRSFSYTVSGLGE